MSKQGHKGKLKKLDQTFQEDYVWAVSAQDELEVLNNFDGLPRRNESMLEYNPYQQEGWDD